MEGRKIIVDSEDSAWSVLEGVLQQQIVVDEHTTLEFKGWPVIQFRIEGRRWRQSVPTRIMPAILDVQKDLYRAYARVRYGSPDIRKLTDEEREALEIVVAVGDGSSEFVAAIEQALNTFVAGAVSKMSPMDYIVTILGLAFIFASGLGWKHWLDKMARDKEVESRVDLSREETRRLEIMASVAQQKPAVLEAKEDADESRNRLIRALDQSDRIDIAGIELPGAEAAILSHTPRERSVPKRIDGVFNIITVNSADPSAFRLHLRSTDGETDLHVSAREAVLTHDMRTALQEGEWKRRPVRFSINAKELRGQITSADVVSAELEDDT